MKNRLEMLKEKVLNGYQIYKKEALFLAEQPLEELCKAADEIRRAFCGNAFDLCTIINGKSGKCSENCKYCAQSSFYQTHVESYPLLGTEELVQQAEYNSQRGVPRYSIVTSGKKLNSEEVEQVCESIRQIKKSVNISVCVSFGLLEEEDFRKIKEAGAERVHNNLETSEVYFPKVCTTHTWQDKIRALKNARAAGMSVCSGGIMGLGETMEDRIDLALTLQNLGVNSVPINMLNPIPGTPYEKNPKLTEEDMRRIIAVFRFILPKSFIRLAGGRGLMEDQGRNCFRSGANAAITGDMLTTAGITIRRDMEMLKELGYQVVKV
ncbi:biotin synthase [Eubacterium sp. 14-2]|uniref:biotin synthase BioB n=1 Tax=Eubacterium sp. 14-2 TaxID=1235790 RepID=UPI000334B8AB|nr:biotin synthase BioB [Eubacterium sp. 14-2]EOT28616.1 biotin synthase [Eubacterium sp. 14-2]